jgi:hypothetical protein
MAASGPIYDQERRQGDDVRLKVIRWLAVSGWILLVIALFLLGYAKPQVETFFDRYYELRLESSWNMTLASYMYYLLIIGQFSSVAGLVINVTRHRRYNDEYRYSLILMAIVCAVGIILYHYTFH